MPRSTPIAQGDIVLVPFPFADLTGNKVRPAVIVSADPQSSEIIVAFVTSVLTNRSPRGAEVELLQADTDFGVTGLKIDSLVRLDKLATLSANIITRRLGRLGSTARANIAAKLRLAFGL